MTPIIGAAYSMTNHPSGNNIIIHSIAADSTVSFAGFTSAGGKGEHADAAGSISPDALLTQGCMQVFGHHLFAVNPASNTVVMFAIDPKSPTKLSMVGTPVSSGGDFPVSVAVHPKTGNVYVLNGGKANGVASFTVDSSSGLKPSGTLHSLDLDLATPPTGPPNTVSHILFSTDGSKLRASVKGSSTVPGFVATWDVASDGSLSFTPVKSMPPSVKDGALPFGMGNVVGATDAVLASDVDLGATVYDFAAPKTAYHPTPISGQMATCWVQYSEKTGSYWLSDFDAVKIYEMIVDLKNLEASLVSTLQLGDDNNPLEIAVGTISGNDYLYVLSPVSSSVNVLSLQSGGKSKVIQTYSFAAAATAAGLKYDINYLEGMAVFVSA